MGVTGAGLWQDDGCSDSVVLIKTFHYTHSLAVGFIEWTLLLDLGKLHVNLLTDHRHGISS